MLLFSDKIKKKKKIILLGEEGIHSHYVQAKVTSVVHVRHGSQLHQFEDYACCTVFTFTDTHVLYC